MLSRSVLQNVRRFTAFVILLASLYMLTYSGLVETGDALGYYDAITSQVRFGDRWLDESMWHDPPTAFLPGMEYPLRQFNAEDPLLVELGALLFRLMERVPGVGLVHSVWLFNIVVTALTGGLVFLYGRALRYQTRTALLAAVIFGAGTLAWPYSKTFFRDPLAMFFLFAAALLLQYWRTHGGWRPQSLPWLLAGGLLLICAVLSKTSALFALPALLVMLLPARAPHPLLRRLPDLLLAAGLALTVLLLLAEPLTDALAALLARPLPTRGTDYVHTALHAYLLSPGGSIWGTSPILLLSIPGLWLLHRAGRRRLVWLVVLVLLGYAFGHAFLIGSNWFGGLSWPPRFLLPAVPFLALGLLPLLERLQRRRFVALAGGAALLLYSLWVQFNAVALDWLQYPRLLPPEANRVADWLPGIYDPIYWRWVLLPQGWDALSFDFVWDRTNQPLWPLAFMGLMLMATAALYFDGRRLARLRTGWLAPALPLLFVLALYAGLRFIHDHDHFYRTNQPALHEVLRVLEAEAGPGDVVLLADSTYERFVLNYNRLDRLRFIVLPHQPGEAASERQPAPVSSDNPQELLTRESIAVILGLARDHERFWLLAHNSPFLPWSVRPVERFLAMYFYPLGAVALENADPTVRLLEFSTVRAPDPYLFRAAEYSSELYFGESLHLAGFELPLDMTYTPGLVLPISLYWQALAPVEHDYSVALFLADPATGAVITQGYDSQPYLDFAPTSTWQPDLSLWDNRALRLPADAAPGRYVLWLRLYRATEAGLETLPVRGPDVVGADIAVLPVTITLNGP